MPCGFRVWHVPVHTGAQAWRPPSVALLGGTQFINVESYSYQIDILQLFVQLEIGCRILQACKLRTRPI